MSFQSLKIFPCGFLILILVTGWGGTVHAADPVVGNGIYSKQCKNCHGSGGSPQLPGVPDFSRGEGLLQADSVLREKIKDGMGMMPAYKGILSDEEILDVIAYLRTLR